MTIKKRDYSKSLKLSPGLLALETECNSGTYLRVDSELFRFYFSFITKLNILTNWFFSIKNGFSKNFKQKK
jgi:hypothetical protein